MPRKTALFVSFVIVYLVSFVGTVSCSATEVLIVGDTQLRPVAEIVSGIRKTLKSPIRIYSPSEVRGTLSVIVEKEDAKVVVALGKTALSEALRLPPSIPVIYDLVVVPPVITRPNTTGFYMATPAREYAELIKNHLHGIKRVAVVGSRNQLKLLARGEFPQQTVFGVKSSMELITTVRQFDGSEVDAIMLLPDTSLLTATAMDEAYLMSFKKGIPLIGISEQNVKEGALLALVVDTVNVGKLIGEAATRAIRGGSIGQIPPSPPRKFDMFLNTATASRMGIQISSEMVRMAKKVYP
jgi:ABC-type uncharacterized transport system substrate-binding protein